MQGGGPQNVCKGVVNKTHAVQQREG